VGDYTRVDGDDDEDEWDALWSGRLPMDRVLKTLKTIVESSQKTWKPIESVPEEGFVENCEYIVATEDGYVGAATYMTYFRPKTGGWYQGMNYRWTQESRHLALSPCAPIRLSNRQYPRRRKTLHTRQ